MPIIQINIVLATSQTALVKEVIYFVIIWAKILYNKNENSPKLTDKANPVS
jgi:hypothetical protein